MGSKIDQFRLNFKYAFRLNKPILVIRLVFAFIKSYILKVPFLRYVDFAIGFECNLVCDHCFATVLRKDGRKTMSTEDYSKVAKQCMKLGAVNFSFQGGEPLMIKKLASTIKACRPAKNVISVTTNGTLLTKEKIRELKKIGVDILTVSLDSSIPEEHDKFRKMKGAYEKATNGIKLALKNGLNVTVGTVVTHNTLRSEGITGLIDMAKKMKIILTIILPVSAGRWIEKNDMFLTEEDINYIDNLTKESPYIRTDFQANLGGYGCGAGKEILYLSPYGDVYVCPFMHIKFGNIFEESIDKIRSRALQVPALKKYNDKCLVSTDKEFLDKYLSKTFNCNDLPIDCHHVFENIN